MCMYACTCVYTHTEAYTPLMTHTYVCTYVRTYLCPQVGQFLPLLLLLVRRAFVHDLAGLDNLIPQGRVLLRAAVESSFGLILTQRGQGREERGGSIAHFEYIQLSTFHTWTTQTHSWTARTPTNANVV